MPSTTCPALSLDDGHPIAVPRTVKRFGFVCDPRVVMREPQCRAAAAFERGKHILSFGPQTKSLVARDTYKLNHGGCRNSASFGDDRLDQRLNALLARQHRDQRRSINQHRGNQSSSHSLASIPAIAGYVCLGTRAWGALISAQKNRTRAGSGKGGSVRGKFGGG